MMTISHHDTTSIPLVYAGVLKGSNLNSNSSDFNSKAIEYVLIYTVFIIIYKWSIAYS